MNSKIALGAGAAVLLIAAFFGGYKYASAKSAAVGATARGGMVKAYGAAGGVGRFGMAGGATFGQIVSKDEKSVTISLPSGGSKIVFLSASTTVSKMAAGSLNDLTVGESVTVMGSADSDGSLTASSVDIRPAPQLAK